MDQNFRNAMIGTFAGAAIVGVTAYFLLRLALQPLGDAIRIKQSGSEDDRPPVVVTSGGSVDVFVEPPVGNTTGPGVFLTDPTTGLVYHAHSGKPTVGFRVFITNYLSCTNGRTPPFFADDMTFTYAKNLQTQNFRVFVDNTLNGLEYLTINLNTEKGEWDPKQKHTFKLKHQDNWVLRSVDFPNISKCTLRETFANESERPKVTVKQLHQ